MSRLDSFIRRMCAQRDILDGLVEPLHEVEGAVLEFGLGSGRTFDHLCQRFPDRRIVVFERDVREGCLPVPPPAELVMGEIRDTAASLLEGCAALVHIDIDSGRTQADADLLGWLPALVVYLLGRNGIVASSVAVPHPQLVALPLPSTVSEGRYHVAKRVVTVNTQSVG